MGTARGNHDAQEAGGPGAELASMLRKWWDDSARDGQPKATQQSLAKQLVITQATLSRYLNPRHPSNAPLRVIAQLHTHLGAPVEELERARALYEAAGTEPPRRRTGPDDTGAVTGPAGAEASAPETGDTPATECPPAGAPARRRSVLRAAAAVLAVLLAGLATWWATTAPAFRPDNGKSGTHALSADRTPGRATWPLIREGDRGGRVFVVQHLLAEHGYRLNADGIFGKITKTEARKLQRRAALLPDGEIGPDTWPHLIVPVDSRSKGHAVEALQILLHHAGHRTSITGDFTAATGESLRSFQGSHGLTVTGVADEETWLLLVTSQRPAIHS
ncbi:peptidoglycan-binding protein [Streptomyces sp. NPDC056835]|uniref:peptidoglycan-binding protein n=1 Tax=Streptomyces sp. NPDC056835 TaxID=3345956 RepID=UPI003698EF76